ncbi:pyroglutamyl-peptidase I [Gemella sp. zg-570]|uniref:pyroglutamyl-peptidase I n=1 Tax=Gemella sp. zg-570 TaxID=2840371 RepID=UPI001C0CA78F|nr:pyroglutamyl-peptidase I [Gemella sp. zg-570]QWQ38379.1 pyroglutamyl-peptidase I [Gemella sp. zg-570]
MKVLITGFEAFGNDKLNSSAEIVYRLPDKLNDILLIKKIIPTVFNKSAEMLKKEIDSHKPDIVICVGQAGGKDRKKIAVERVAINIDDARIADNEGNRPLDKIIQENGSTAYFSTLPIKAIYSELIKNNIPTEISNSAGTFVCNHIMYQSLYLSNTKYNFKTGFIHIPYIKEQVHDDQTPYIEIEKLVQAIKIIISTSLEYHNKSDLLLEAGKEY